MNTKMAQRLARDVSAVIMSHVACTVYESDPLQVHSLTDLRYDLGNRLKELRIDYGHSQQEVSDSTGLSRTIISQIERGTGNPTLETLYVLARHFDITVGELLR